MQESARIAAHPWCGAELNGLASCIEGAQTSKADVGGRIGVISSAMFFKICKHVPHCKGKSAYNALQRWNGFK